MITALRTSGISLLISCLPLLSIGQATMNFSFQAEGVDYKGSVQVFLQSNGEKIPVNGAVNLKNEYLFLCFNNFNLDAEGGTETGILIGARCIKMSDNLSGDLPPGLQLKAKPKIPILLKGTGKAFIKISCLFHRAGGGENYFDPQTDITIPFTITGEEDKPLTPETTVATQTKPNKPQSEPNDNSPKVQADLEAFNKAMATPGERDKHRALIAFIDDWGEKSPKLVAKALRNIPIVPNLIPNETGAGKEIQKYELLFVCDPKIDSVWNHSNIEATSPKGLIVKHGSKYFLELKVTGMDSSIIYISDPCKEIRYQSIAKLIIGNVLRCALSGPKEGADVCSLQLTGGVVTPEIVQFYRNGKIVSNTYFAIGRTDTTYTFTKQWLRDKSQKSDTFTVKVMLKNGDPITAAGSIYLEPLQPVWLYVLAGLALIGLFIYLYLKARKRARLNAIAAKAKLKQAENPEPDPMPDPVITTETAATNPGGGFVKIRSINTAGHTDPKALDEKTFDESLKTGEYYLLKVSQLWHDTILNEIYLGKRSMQGISDFLHNQRTQAIVDEQEGTIPEIGGFLLGKYHFSENTQRYRVLLDEFVPIVPEEHNVYQLQFSTESLVRELGDMQDEFPDMSLVGWFHTHPGHGLFLSKPDLMIHEGFFKELYQFAMEIDTLSPRLDTGFFTRTINKTVNNQDALTSETQWFSWYAIEKDNGIG